MIVMVLQVLMLIPVAILLIVGAGVVACCAADRVRALIAANDRRWR